MFECKGFKVRAIQMTPDRHSNSSDQPKTLSQLSILVHTSLAGVKDRESWYKEAKVAYIFLSRCSGSLIENCVSVIVLCDVVGSFFSLFAQTLFPPTVSLICLQHTCAAVTHLGIGLPSLSSVYGCPGLFSTIKTQYSWASHILVIR